MKQNVESTGKSVQLLKPEYAQVVEKFAALGFVCVVQDIYLGKVKDKFNRKFSFAELCYCLNVFDSVNCELSGSEPAAYSKKVVCLSYFGDKTEIFADQDICIEILYPGNFFVYEAAVYQVPVVKSTSEPYVLSQADALGLFHKAGFVHATAEDIFIGTFSFANHETGKLACPEAQKHYGVGVSYMIHVDIGNIPSVAVVRAFNEMIPKTVICVPLSCAVIRRYLPHDSFKTVCGEMAMINGVMVNYGKWLKEKLNQIHDSCGAKLKLQFC